MLSKKADKQITVCMYVHICKVQSKHQERDLLHTFDDGEEEEVSTSIHFQYNDLNPYECVYI